MTENEFIEAYKKKEYRDAQIKKSETKSNHQLTSEEIETQYQAFLSRKDITQVILSDGSKVITERRNKAKWAKFNPLGDKIDGKEYLSRQTNPKRKNLRD